MSIWEMGLGWGSYNESRRDQNMEFMQELQEAGGCCGHR